ncbi:hypothetical protein TPE_1302 [Treponema pedis str. T A4]|uniref:Uncharacterized protein n=1 Tax=Treponema pedis str. T A4 TaxID=1291379 RepID=S5ZZP6_9SPIR|nr:hypothetical protein TPE_1302 [Treponema pedis str. T A4]
MVFGDALIFFITLPAYRAVHISFLSSFFYLYAGQFFTFFTG